MGTLHAVVGHRSYLSESPPSQHEVTLREMLTNTWWDASVGVFQHLAAGSGAVSKEQFSAVLPSIAHAALFAHLKQQSYYGAPDAAEHMHFEFPLLTQRVFVRADSDANGRITLDEFTAAKQAFLANSSYFLFNVLNDGAHPSILVPVHAEAAVSELVGAPAACCPVLSVLTVVLTKAHASSMWLHRLWDLADSAIPGGAADWAE